MARTLLPRGLFTQLRGDWEYFHQVLGLPGWHTVSMCCWCTAGLHNWKNLRACLPIASDEFFSSAARDGHYLAPLLSCPGITTSSILPDWLHTVDLGVGCSLLGQVLWEALEALYHGDSRQERLAKLWQDVLMHYKACKPPSSLDCLTLQMIRRRPREVPWLKCKAGESRGLQPLLLTLSSRLHEVHRSDHSQKVLDLCSTFLALVKTCTSEECYNQDKG